MNPFSKNPVTEHQVLIERKIASNMLGAINALQWIAIGLLSTISFYFESETDDRCSPICESLKRRGLY